MDTIQIVLHASSSPLSPLLHTFLIIIVTDGHPSQNIQQFFTNILSLTLIVFTKPCTLSVFIKTLVRNPLAWAESLANLSRPSLTNYEIINTINFTNCLRSIVIITSHIRYINYNYNNYLQRGVVYTCRFVYSLYMHWDKQHTCSLG